MKDKVMALFSCLLVVSMFVCANINFDTTVGITQDDLIENDDCIHVIVRNRYVRAWSNDPNVSKAIDECNRYNAKCALLLNYRTGEVTLN